MATYGGSRSKASRTYEVLVNPQGPGTGDIQFPDGTSVPWRADGGGVWVFVGSHDRGTIREVGHADHNYIIIGVVA